MMFQFYNSHYIFIDASRGERLLHEILVHISQPSIGHRGAYGHEFLDLEVDATGKLKYHNNSEYKSDQLIRKEGYKTII
jgi:hypothetical protein